MSWLRDSGTDVLDYCTADAGDRLYGIELEIEVASSDYDSVLEYLDENFSTDIILKEDGSLGGSRRGNQYYGIEIVTRPMTFENQIAFWTDSIAKIRTAGDCISNYGGRCGVHIHVTKKAIEGLLFGITNFINEPANAGVIQRVARRYNSNWALMSTREKGQIRQNDKYNAVHIGHTTVEFRLFRGTLRRKRMLAYLEFLDCLFEFVEENRDKAEHCGTEQEFIRKATTGRWDNLKTILEENR